MNRYYILPFRLNNLLIGQCYVKYRVFLNFYSCVFLIMFYFIFHCALRLYSMFTHEKIFLKYQQKLKGRRKLDYTPIFLLHALKCCFITMYILLYARFFVQITFSTFFLFVELKLVATIAAKFEEWCHFTLHRYCGTGTTVRIILMLNFWGKK